MAAEPLNTFSIVDLSDNLIKMKVWDIITNGKIEAAGEFEQNGNT